VSFVQRRGRPTRCTRRESKVHASQPVAIIGIRTPRRQHRAGIHVDVEAGAAVQQVPQAKLAQRVVVFVERKSVESQCDAAALAEHFGNRCDARADAEVRARVDGDRRAAFRDDRKLPGACPGAMRERQPWAQQSDCVEIADDSLRVVLVGPIALVARFQQMHVHPPPCSRRGLGDGRQKSGRAPLHAGGSVLHVEFGPVAATRHRFDARHRVGDRQWRLEKSPFNFGARGGRQRIDNRFRRSVHQRIDVAQRHGESHAHADIAGGARDLLRFGDQIRQTLHARVMDHDGAGAAKRAVRQRHGGGEIGVDRGQHRHVVQPGFQWLAARAERTRAHRAGMVVSVDERRHHQRRIAVAGFALADRGDQVIVDADSAIADRTRLRGGKHERAIDVSHRSVVVEPHCRIQARATRFFGRFSTGARPATISLVASSM